MTSETLNKGLMIKVMDPAKSDLDTTCQGLITFKAFKVHPIISIVALHRRGLQIITRYSIEFLELCISYTCRIQLPLGLHEGILQCLMSNLTRS